MDATNQLLFSCLILLMGCSTIHGSEYIEGRRTPCTNEGEEVAVDSIKDMKCFKCICQNGFVECEPESCPAVDDCYIIFKKPVGGCCDKCKECVFQGSTHQSGAEWTRHEDSCINFKCVAGMLTESETQCYTPCSQPTPPKAGQCCPTCLGCYLNGQHVLEGREVTLSEDPCVKCQCKGKRLTCQKKACPVLQCPLSKQAKAPGECCPRCIARRELIQIPGNCIFGVHMHMHGNSFLVDACTRCTCVNGTAICQRNTCPVLECPQEYQEITPGDCCPRCPLVDEVKSICSYEGRTYQNNDTFLLGPCRSCQCRSGEIRCAETQCPKKRCRPNEILVTPPDQCCSRCVETPGVCTVFGDPHYKTFDGKFFSFQGSCKYQLTADCVDNSFSIRVTNDARTTKFSSWTKTVTLKMGDYKVNLGQKLRVKINGLRVETPFRSDRVFVERLDDMVVVNTDLNIKMTWDGSNYLQVQVPVTFKNKLCGLCGNYNNVFRDDLMSRRGVNLNDTDVVKFANSWRVGGTKACARQKENLNKQPTCRLKKPSTICKPLQRADFFGNCNSRLNPNNYFEACKLDMCECPTGMCYCESFAAYARECQRLGVQLSNWRLETNCEQNSVQHKQNLIQKLEEMRRHRKKTRNRKQQESIFKHIPKPILKQYTPFEGRTPPPLY